MALALPLKDKPIILTGGAQGLGAATVRVLARQGAIVYSLDIRDEDGEKVAREVTESEPGKAFYRHVDVTKRAEVFGAVEAIARENGDRLHAVVNVAGIGSFTPLVHITEAQFDLHYAVHVKGTLFACQAAHPFLRANGIGFIVNFASDAGIGGVPGTGTYSAAKGAVMALTRTTAAEWGPDEIRANVINPVAASGMLAGAVQMDPERRATIERQIRERCPLGGIKGDAERDIGPVVAFLCSEAARWVSGQLIPVNGGMTFAR